jgi:hypothetical protein
MSDKVVVVSGSSLETSGGQTEGMARQNAISGISDQLCGSGKSIRQYHTASLVAFHRYSMRLV